MGGRGLIQLHDVTKRFGDLVAVNKLNLEIEKGHLTMLIGPSGCGKTTSLKMINRLVDVSEGDIQIDGKSIYSLNPVELRRGIGYVIQEIGLFPHMNVHDNIAIVPRLLKWDEKTIHARVEELLDLVTLDSSYMYKYPLQLSGGERQRVGLARGLAADPDILLMDEPFGAIDPINRAKLHASFISIQEQIKKTIVFVTHDINEAIKLGNKIAILRKGKLIQYNDVAAILNEPANEFVENLLGHDRNIKALALKKNKDFISKTGYITCDGRDEPETIINRMRASNAQISIVLGKDRVFQGIQILTKRKSEQSFRLIAVEEPTTVEKNGNLQESFSKMIQTGESRLPVIDERNHFEGLIRLADIFQSFQVV
jgi:osmoprotectant transport system ATP-binding protein